LSSFGAARSTALSSLVTLACELELVSFADPQLDRLSLLPHGLRRGLHSERRFAAGCFASPDNTPTLRRKERSRKGGGHPVGDTRGRYDAQDTRKKNNHRGHRGTQQSCSGPKFRTL